MAKQIAFEMDEGYTVYIYLRSIDSIAFEQGKIHITSKGNLERTTFEDVLPNAEAQYQKLIRRKPLKVIWLKWRKRDKGEQATPDLKQCCEDAVKVQ